MPTRKNKTKPTSETPAAFIKTLPKEQQVEAKQLLKIFTAVTNAKPVMWGNIFGFGSYHYKYDSGREGDFLATGFAMRKGGPTIYIMPGYNDYGDLLEKLGPHKLGKSCLYIKKIEDLHLPTLEKLIKAGLRDLKKQYPVTWK
jgi:hypothetical protein